MTNPVAGISRRRFVQGSAAITAAMVWPPLARSAQTDTVVIGAGAAGIAAARALREANLNVTVIEAAARIGGRVHTDLSMFGVPYDLGAHWLHVGRLNPFLGYGRENGFDIYEAPDDTVLYVGDRRASQSEYSDYESALSAVYEAIARAGRRDRDVSAASVLPETNEWHELARMVIGPWSMGKNLEQFSTRDWWTGEDGRDWYCRQGYGALWAHSARNVPVELSTRARRIKWGGPDVRVETDRGTITARTCIVTVSTGVLAQEGILFDPPLSANKQEAFQRISMGLYNHIAFQFRRNIFGTNDDGYLLYKLTPSASAYPRGFGLLTNIGGTNLSFGDVGGGLAWELEREGPEAALAFGLEELRGMFGSDVDKEFIKGHVTAWGKNPFTLGSYASAEPGAFHLRKQLREPVGEKIWFAGEACSPNLSAMVAGAHKSGSHAAADLINVHAWG